MSSISDTPERRKWLEDDRSEEPERRWQDWCIENGDAAGASDREFAADYAGEMMDLIEDIDQTIRPQCRHLRKRLTTLAQSIMEHRSDSIGSTKALNRERRVR